MARRSHRVRSVTRALVLVGLLLVPLVVSGHGHHGGAASSTCQSCVLAHHAPVAAQPATTVAHAPMVGTQAPARGRDRIAGDSHRRPHSGRAPPARLPTIS